MGFHRPWPLLLFLLLIPTLVLAQLPSQTRSATIRGQVRMADGSSPNGVLVSITSTRSLGNISQVHVDSRGKFEFENMPWDVYRVYIEHPGYKPVSQMVDVQQAASGYVVLELKPLPSTGPPPVPPEGPGAVLPANVPAAAFEEFKQGEQELQDKHAKEAVKHFEKAVELYPEYTAAYLGLGMSYLEMKKWKDAEKALERTVELDPNHGAAQLALGSALNQQTRFAEAESHLKHGLELLPQSSRGHYEMARVYWEQQKWQEAGAHASKCVELEPDFALGHVMLGNVSLRLRDAQTALREFKEYLRLAPDGELAAPTRDLVQRIEKALRASNN